MWRSGNRGRTRETENHKASFICLWIVQTALAPAEAVLLWGVVNLSGLPTDRLSNKYLTKARTVQRGGEERGRARRGEGAKGRGSEADARHTEKSRWGLMNPERKELKPAEVAKAASRNYRCAFGFIVN